MSQVPANLPVCQAGEGRRAPFRIGSSGSAREPMVVAVDSRTAIRAFNVPEGNRVDRVPARPRDGRPVAVVVRRSAWVW